MNKEIENSKITMKVSRLKQIVELAEENIQRSSAGDELEILLFDKSKYKICQKNLDNRSKEIRYDRGNIKKRRVRINYGQVIFAILFLVVIFFSKVECRSNDGEVLYETTPSPYELLVSNVTYNNLDNSR